MPNKYTFTYEYVPVEYAEGTPKTTAVLMVENAETLSAVLSSFQNFLSASGFSFELGDYLTVVNDEKDFQNAQENSNTQETKDDEGVADPPF